MRRLFIPLFSIFLIVLFFSLYFFYIVKMPTLAEYFHIKEGASLLVSKLDILINNYSIGDLVIFKENPQSNFFDVGIILDYDKTQDKFLIEATHYSGLLDKSTFIAKVIRPRIDTTVKSQILADHFISVYIKNKEMEADKLPKESLSQLQTKRAEYLKVQCKDNYPIYSSDKIYIACLVDNQYVIGRKLGVTSKTSDDNYYRLYEQTGKILSGKNQYIAYADYSGIFEEAGFYGAALDEIYSRIFEINPEKKLLRVIATPFMFSNSLMREWFLTRRAPQFMLTNNSIVNGNKITMDVVECTGCESNSTKVELDINTSTIRNLD